MRVLFESCDPRWYTGVCKSNTEINEWIKDKHLIALQNEELFKQDYNNPISKVARITRF